MIGSVRITAADGQLFLRSGRGAWRNELRMLPADLADPALFALVFDDNGRVKGIRFDRLMYVQRNEAP